MLGSLLTRWNRKSSTGPFPEDRRPCECIQAGYCPRYNLDMPERLYQLCSGRCPPENPCTDQMSLGYRIRLSVMARGDSLNDLRPRRNRSGWIRRVLTFMRALVYHATQGFRLVPISVFIQRTRVCTGDPAGPRQDGLPLQPKCPHYMKDYPGGRCGKCGCGIAGQVGTKPEASLPWYRLVARIRRRWNKVWGKAWWKSEDCPVCSKCGQTRGIKTKTRCECAGPFISKWRAANDTGKTETETTGRDA